MSIAMPQLRVRSGYSFRYCYGHMHDIASRLKELGCPAAALVDFNTFGHVEFAKALSKTSVKAGFGMEIPVIIDEETKRTSWILAKDTKEFYKLTSEAVQNGGLPAERFADMSGVVRFSGCGLDNPDHFDYIDVNPFSLFDTRRGLDLAKRTGKPIVVTSDVLMPRQSDERYAEAWECRLGVTPSWILSDADVYEYFGQFFDKPTITGWIDNTFAAAELIKDAHLNKAPIIEAEGDLLSLCRQGQQYRLEKGHIAEWTKEYEDRLIEELHQISRKEFDAYFIIVSDLVQYAKTKMIVGPARGSSAGSLVCYLLRITEVDPLVHNLLFMRFIDVSRGGFVYNGGFKGFEDDRV